MSPTVTFVVPCYKLAHLLGECIDSILAQTYTDFEILIMDDCSPDHTPQVAQSYKDPRVKHIRNEPNLKHLRNYNKGIGLAQGKYVWLISADDCLHRNDALERFVAVLDQNPKVGYVFSPAVRLENGVRGEVLDYSVHSETDTIFDGRYLLRTLVMQNTIVAPSVLVRKECYDKVSVFPLDMPWGGDWYLWCVFAMHYDVAYLAEPMVCYRRHTGSMTNQLTTAEVHTCVAEDVAMPWIIKRKAEEAGHHDLIPYCLKSAAKEYARSLTSRLYRTATSDTTVSITFADMEESLQTHASNNQEKISVRAQVYAGVADWYFWEGGMAEAREYYALSLAQKFWAPKVWGKYLTILGGSWGLKARASVASVRRALSA